MGFCFSFIPFFDLCHRNKALVEPLIALGSQEIHESQNDIIAFAKYSAYEKLAQEKSVRSLFLERYNIADYKDYDLNDKADIKIDLCQPIGTEMTDSANTILDAGTIEHVFDIGQALINIHDMIKVDGIIIHVAPITWYNHGFFNYNPRLFKAIMFANHYQLVAEAFHFPHDVMGAVKAANPSLYITFDGIQSTSLAIEIQKILSSEVMPANVLYMIAYRKMKSRDFICPYDIQE